jgi:hypothetical protein
LTLRETFLDLFWGGTCVMVGPDATRNMVHYLDNDGKDWWVDLDKMIREVPSARVELDKEIAQAKRFSETLGPCTYDIVSTGLASGYNYQRENNNWYLAVGGYTHWGKGHLVVTDNGNGKHYDLLFEYHFYDRYNWDKEIGPDGKTYWKSTDIPLPKPVAWGAQCAGFDPGQDPKVGDPGHSIHVTDELMGQFQLQGLAKEYDDYGVSLRRLEWNQGDPSISPSQVDRPIPVPRM